MSTNNPVILDAAIEWARVVKTGYNYIPTKEVTAFKGISGWWPHKKIEQLSLNYATLASTLAVQLVQNNKEQNFRTQRFTTRRKSDMLQL